jgi:hypothetical protein
LGKAETVVVVAIGNPAVLSVVVPTAAAQNLVKYHNAL